MNNIPFSDISDLKFLVRVEPLNMHVKTLLMAANLPLRMEIR
jgi:hypothetical protein